MKLKFVLPLIALAAVLIYVVSTCFIAVSETEVVVVTTFGSVRDVVTEPGLAFKLPDPIEMTVRLDSRLQRLDTNASEFLTSDKKNLMMSAFVLWRVSDAKTFLQSVGDHRTAALRLSDLATSEIGLSVGTYELSDFLRVSDEEPATKKLMEEVTSRCAKKAASDFGIEVVDVRLRRMNFPQQNLRSVFDRMKAERERMARKYLAEGEEQAKRIRAETDQEVRLLLANADKEARIVRGEGEAEATRIYAEAHQAAPEFYTLMRSLEAYRKILDEQTTLILSADSPIFRFLGGDLSSMKSTKK